jgi:indole-3-glycerol phosphate synthase
VDSVSSKSIRVWHGFEPELQIVTGPRRFSQAISEGDGISIIAEVSEPDAARLAESHGAEGVLVHSGLEKQLQSIREAVSVPILFYWDGERADRLLGADACVVGVAEWSGDVAEHARLELDDSFELALRVADEEELEEALELFDPELFVLVGKDEQALERVLDLLPDVPAGKLVIAELPAATRADVEQLERAGTDAVIVRAGNIADLAGEPPPEV